VQLELEVEDDDLTSSGTGSGSGSTSGMSESVAEVKIPSSPGITEVDLKRRRLSPDRNITTNNNTTNNTNNTENSTENTPNDTISELTLSRAVWLEEVTNCYEIATDLSKIRVQGMCVCLICFVFCFNYLLTFAWRICIFLVSNHTTQKFPL
jgi:hypothetical protein